MDEKILDWVTLAEKFSADGDPMSMRTVAREIFELFIWATSTKRNRLRNTLLPSTKIICAGDW